MTQPQSVVQRSRKWTQTRDRRETERTWWTYIDGMEFRSLRAVAVHFNLGGGVRRGWCRIGPSDPLKRKIQEVTQSSFLTVSASLGPLYSYTVIYLLLPSSDPPQKESSLRGTRRQWRRMRKRTDTEISPLNRHKRISSATRNPTPLYLRASP